MSSVDLLPSLVLVIGMWPHCFNVDSTVYRSSM